MSTRARGLSLIELVVFIVIVGVAMAGLFAAYNTMTAGSADPQVRKQVLAIAESLMEEVQLMPFTYCDPDDSVAATAADDSVCPNKENGGALGPEGETRYGPTQFDNVSDYNGFSMTGIKDINGNDVTACPGGNLCNYTASIAVSRATLGPAGANQISNAGEALLISVQVTHPSGVSITLNGYRTRYAPNTLP